TTVSIETVRLSSVITDCGGKETTCSRRSIRDRTRSRNGTRKFSPGAATERNLPSRSTTADCAWGTTMTALTTVMTTTRAMTTTILSTAVFTGAIPSIVVATPNDDAESRIHCCSETTAIAHSTSTT